MKKRILAGLLMTCMLVTMLPVTAFAAEDIALTDESTQSPTDDIGGEDGAAPNAGQSASSSNNAALAADPTLVAENIEITIDNITYTIDFYSDGTNRWANIWKMTNPATPTEVTLPRVAEYNGEEYLVTEIQFTQWDKCKNVTKLTLPDSLTTVNSSSFYKFPNLTEMTIPGSIKNFGGSFQNMDKLETLTFEEGVEEISANSMLRNCDALTAIKLPSSLKRITEPAVFGGATALESITLPEGLVMTEGSLFSGCTALTSVELPASMTEILSSTFSGCTSLQSVTAKETITSIGASAFYKCSALKTIPDLGQVTKIGSNAFEECGKLTGPLDLSNVTEMGANAFYHCDKLTGALDLSKLNKIPSKAFSYTSVDSVTLSDELTAIEKWAFLYTDISTIQFPNTLTSIGTYAFWNAKKLGGTVTIPDSVTTIEKLAFSGTAIEKFEIGSGVVSLQADMFKNNPALKEIVFDNSQDGVQIIGDMPEGVTVTYKQQSIDDSVGDQISSAVDAPKLQEAVTAAAENGGKVTLEKNIKLTDTVTVPAGKTVTITADVPVQIAGTKTAKNLKNLFVVEKGGSLVITGKVTLFGRYNTGSIILNYGALELTGDAVVTGAKISNDYANDLVLAGLGVIDSRGEDAVFTLSGGKITDNALTSDRVSYSGIVRASDGAHVEITGGEISDNRAVAAAALNSSSGLLLYDNASGTMTGGTISGNTGHRGSAVMIWGYTPQHRPSFALSGGVITNNVCSSTAKVLGSGAVHVDNNAEFIMTGGTISGNKGVQGAGVCVADNSLQNGPTEYKTAFIMEGGTISGNTGSTGGGIYSCSNGVELRAGNITGNTAYNMGGGIYSEGNLNFHSTLQLSNALISRNTARQGGGLWFCATGVATVHGTEGAAIFDNTARDADNQKAAGDDFVFSAREADDYPATLSNRVIGGGAVRWYRDGGVSLPAVGSNPVTQEDAPRYGAPNADPNPVTLTNYKNCIALKSVPLSAEVKQMAQDNAVLMITGNTADKGGGIGSNGGIVIGKEPATSVAVSKTWSGDSASSRPDHVIVDLLNDGCVIDTVSLTAENDWKYTFEGLPTTDKNGKEYQYTISEREVSGYTTKIAGDAKTGFIITNTKGSADDRGSSSTRVTLHYVSNGGTEYRDERYDHNTIVKMDKFPTREGYTFTGWYADKDLTNRITEVKMTSDKTVYAGWQPTGVPEWLNGDDHFAYVIGYPDGKVHPNGNITRAETATIFFRLLNEDVREGNLTAANNFADVDKGVWYNIAISTMAKLGIVKGRSAERFAPDAPITRAEFAAICARFDTSKRDGDSDFTDISGHWAEAEIGCAASLGWIMGYTDGTFHPENYITRAEAMTMINRVLNRLPEDENDLLDGMNIWPDNNQRDWYYLAVQEATNSHDFIRKGEVHEQWTKMITDPDWDQYQ
ncbi:MAG: leucine-rich repeat protein [Agathobaculum desmolans]|uniref:leucine-rich repeat protein n=1 Tax=Agathobaculum desmolans TaxID=39484 RepID=UPI003991D88E